MTAKASYWCRRLILAAYAYLTFDEDTAFVAFPVRLCPFYLPVTAAIVPLMIPAAGSVIGFNYRLTG